MSLLNKKFTGSLSEGTHRVKFTGATEVEAKAVNGTKVSDAYVVLELVTEDGMPFKIVAFEKQLGWIARDLINAYAPGKMLSFAEVLDLVTEIGYIPMTKYTTQGKEGKTFINYSFNPKYSNQPADIDMPDELQFN